MKGRNLQHYLAVIILTSALLSLSCSTKEKKKLTVPVGSCKVMVGDLVITEMLANPKGADNTNEWFEIYNASSADQVLNGLLLRQEYGAGKSKEHIVKSDKELVLKPGEYFVFGDGESDFMDYGYGNGLADWPNNSATLTILCQNVVIDSLTYGVEGSLPEPIEGVAIAFDGSRKPDAQANNDPAAWCNALDLYDTNGNLGTPGSKNHNCTVPTCKINGERVNANTPNIGDLIFTEFLVDPAGVNSAMQGDVKVDKNEYIELLNTSDKDIDLFGLYFSQVKDGSTDSIEHQIVALDETSKNRQACIRVPAGKFILIGMSTDKGRNCNRTPDALFTGSRMPDNSSTFSLYTSNGLLLDYAPYVHKADSVFSLSPDHLDYVDNDNKDNWCSIKGGSAVCEDDGTPGEVNATCDASTEEPPPPPPTCEGDAPNVGDLVITEIYANPPGNGSEEFNKEFIEVLVKKTVTAKSLVINSKTGPDANPRKFVVDFGGCYTMEKGKYIVFGGSDDTEENDNINVDFAYTGSKSGFHQPKSGYLVEVLYDDKVIDSAPNAIGSEEYSTNLLADHLNATDNDDIANWCLADRSAGQASNECHGAPACAEELEPTRGDIIIVEVYADAPGKAGEEFNKEFVKLYFVNEVELTGLTLVSTNDNGSQRSFNADFGQCLHMQAGSYLTIGGSTDETKNGGISVDFAYTGTGGFYQPTNKKSQEIELYYNATWLDRVPNGGAANAVSTETKSAILKPDKFNSEDHSDPANWCLANPAPGRSNNDCDEDVAIVSCPASGAPSPGGIVITEIYSDAQGPAGQEFEKEFIELQFVEAVNISHLHVTSKNNSVVREFLLNFGTCVDFSAGTVIAIGGKVGANTRGSQRVTYAYKGHAGGLDNPCENCSVEIYHTQGSGGTSQDILIDSAPNTKGNESSSANYNPTVNTSAQYYQDNDNADHWLLATPTPGTNSLSND